MKRISLIALLAISISLLALGHPKLSSVNSAIDKQNKELTGGKERPAPISHLRPTLYSRSQTIPAYQSYGINFSPYIDGQDPNFGTVISEEQLRARMEIIADHTIWVRSFGCTHGLEKTGMVAHSLGLKAAVGAWLGPNPAANSQEISNLISAANAGQVDLAIVGSEVLLRNDLSVSDLIGYMNQVRQQIPANIPVTTADVYWKLLENPAVIANSDVVLPNYYPYWEGVSVNIAIATLHRQHQQIVAASQGKSVIVSETGWPSAGNTICNAEPSPTNASFYFLNFVSWVRANNVSYFYFEALDETWKANHGEGPQGAHWGVWDKDGVLKPGMQDVFDGQTIPDNWTSAGVPGGPGTPSIEFTSVPPYGSVNHLFGQVLHVNTDNHKVAVFIRVGSGWWNKPTWEHPLTNIGLTGGWECNITTGENDVNANQIVAYLVPANFIPPEMRDGPTLPPSLDEYPVAEIARSSSLPFIEGRVTDTDNHAVNCVTISLTGSQTTTTHTVGNGNYSFINLQPGGNYTVTPSHPSYVFNPSSLTFNNLGSNQTGDFVAVPGTSTISLSAFPTAGGTLSGAGTFATGSSRTVTAAPNSGYTFTNWAEDGSTVSSSASYTFTLNGNRNLVANFTEIHTLTVRSSNPSSGVSITISPSDNSGSGSGTTQFTRFYINNTSVTLTAPATAGGNNFLKWQRDGDDWSFNQSTSVMMDFNRTMTVIYATPLARINCSQESSLRSIEGVTLSSIQFINNSAEQIRVYWIDYFGNRVPSQTLNAGQSYLQDTSLTHPWVVTNSTNSCLGIYLPIAEPGQAMITTATPVYFISGRVNYADSTTGVMNAGLQLSGSQSANVTTDANGLYAFDGLTPAGNFTVTSTKVGAVSGINTTDATRILQFIAGTFTLSGNQQLAADTSQNGTINTTDVTHVLNFIAGNPAVASNRTGDWRFIPPSRSYTSIATNRTGQNYDALLLGEVSGNWSPAAPSIEVAKSGGPVAVFGRESTATPCGAPPIPLSLPNTSVGSTVTNFTLPITIGDTTGESVTGYNIRFRFDPAVVGLQATPVSTTGTLSSGMSLSTNTNTAGVLTVVAAQANPLTGSGTLLNVNFTRLGAQGTSTALTWEVSELNDAENDCIKPATPINGNIAIAAPTAANGVVSGRITAIDGTPVSGAVIQLTGSQSRKTITDANGDYRFDNVETAGFYTVTPSRANFNFSPTARFFSQLGGRTEAVFAGSFTGDALNPLDTTEYFVRQQYVDILGREPDEGGFNYWSDRILECGSNQLCENARRRDVAAAFYIEVEFQQTGAFIYRLYRSSLGRRPTYAEYTSDRQGIMAGGNPEGNEAALAEGFVQRAEFVGKYQANQTAASFVDAILQTVRQAAGVELGSERAGLIDKYNEGSNLNQSRSLVLRVVSKMPAFRQAEYNGAFVLTEYFGYLRRDPDPGGYDFWLDVLNNRDPGNFRGMVCAFTTSREYQERFSLIVTHFNSECGP